MTAIARAARIARGVAALAASIALATTAWSQTPPADPLVKEGATVSVARHTWVIPDGDVGLVSSSTRASAGTYRLEAPNE